MCIKCSTYMFQALFFLEKFNIGKIKKGKNPIDRDFNCFRNITDESNAIESGT